MVMTKKEFYDKINSVITKAMEELNMINVEIEGLDNIIANTNRVYSPVYIKQKANERHEYEMKLNNIKENANETISAITNKYIEEVKKSNSLKGEEMTDDAKLLNIGIRLSVDDLEKMFDRYDGNYTMQSLIVKYVQQNDIIDFKRVMNNDNAILIETAKQVPGVSKIVLRQFKQKDKFYDQFIGEGSAFYNFAHPGSEE